MFFDQLDEPHHFHQGMRYGAEDNDDLNESGAEEVWDVICRGLKEAWYITLPIHIIVLLVYWCLNIQCHFSTCLMKSLAHDASSVLRVLRIVDKKNLIIVKYWSNRMEVCVCVERNPFEFRLSILYFYYIKWNCGLYLLLSFLFYHNVFDRIVVMLV